MSLMKPTKFEWIVYLALIVYVVGRGYLWMHPPAAPRGAQLRPQVGVSQKAVPAPPSKPRQ